ncbi:8-amino-7-oxononanoate synthase [Telmatocola sphagniphila]|uniref:8-amino-7-oxononanoate synthase n=1 Tax=Telmatocola sphagniphila TaxID=1123043 RepID=A0A8E6B914_9BACT|nr:8-amino-7-oxononanoate synthase [Telmatocola sphagniphila]QVL32615.1 8-amino-7-oxononanoate synthase [Telmatocola sphagniphila]
MSLTARWTGILEELTQQGRFRSLRLPAGIDFSSNDYLGYGNGRLPIPDSSTTLPVSGMASRLLRGQHAIWDQVEAALSNWHSGSSILMMTSGYAANEGLISTVIEPGDWVATDELNHACIIDGLRLSRPRKFSYRHNDLNQLEEGLRSESAKRPEGREMFVITESVFSMDGDKAPLKQIAELCEKYGTHLIVDEAHSTGCYGDSGSGCVDAAGLSQRVLATMHTGGKALGVPGAYIRGSELLKKFLINRCRHLIFTTALPPAIGSWWLAAIERVKADTIGREQLHRNSHAFREALISQGIHPWGTEYVVPVILGDDPKAVRAATKLQEQGFDIRAIRPPSVPLGTARLRISIHADHDPESLRRVADAVVEATRS